AQLGATAAGGGDVNGDGLSDVLVGELRFTGPDSRGYVVYGDSAGVGSNGKTFGDLHGMNVSSLPGTVDINGDGLDDGTAFTGLVSASFATQVGNAGDVDNDGRDDILVGNADRDTRGTDSGEAFLVFGNASRSGLDGLNALGGANGSNVLGFAGQGASTFAGRSVSGVGDINHDGFDDFAIGATGPATDGKVYVVFGDTRTDLATLAGSAATSGIENVLNGSNGFVINNAPFANFGNVRMGEQVSGIGDFNGDGIEDFVLTEPQFGLAFVVLGKATAFGATLDLTNVMNTQVGGFGLVGGITSVAGAGDVNGDGFADLVLGSPSTNDAYILFGTSDIASLISFVPDFGADFVDLTDGVGNGGGAQLLSGGFLFGKGVLLDGAVSTNTGVTVSGVGDVNRDGYDDVAVGATTASPATSTGNPAGQVYVVYGRDFAGTAPAAVTQTAGANGAVLRGSAAEGDTLSSGGHQGVVMTAGAGDDVLRVNGQEFSVDAGGGLDVLTPDAAGLVLDFDALTDKGRYAGVEQVQLNGFGTNQLRLDVRDVLEMSSAPHELLVTGDANVDSVVSAGNGWGLSGTTVRTVHVDSTGLDSSLTFNVYTQSSSAVTLLVQNDLLQSQVS
ncbi:MAG: hypothetical protein AB7Q97_02870, partial [Gammaproteobacteria bacterium]